MDAAQDLAADFQPFEILTADFPQSGPFGFRFGGK